MELKDRLTLLVDKGGGGTRNELMVELILQLETLNETLKRGIITFNGGDAEDVEEEEETEEE